jgi:hypothetical protein
MRNRVVPGTVHPMLKGLQAEKWASWHPFRMRGWS